MFDFLKNHPFAVEAFFENSYVLAFAFPKAAIEPLLPPGLTLDLYDDRWAFLAVALVQTRDLRPKGFPAWMGNDFQLIGYRVFVRYTDARGKRLRGLYILHSETDRRKMEILGNIFTRYQYKTADIQVKTAGKGLQFVSQSSGFSFSMEPDAEVVELPAQSPFPDWKAARRFAGPLPFTFSVLENERKMLLIEGVRRDWEPKPLKITDWNFPFFQSLNLQNPVLANAFQLKNIPYYWKKGRKERLNPSDE